MIKKIIIPILVLIIASLACNAVLQQPGSTQAPVPTVIVEPTSVTQLGFPQTEAEVPRVSVDKAKAALDSGAAIIMDVRSADAYAAKHIKGAISLPLATIELNPASAYKNKEQWIITYCT